MNWLSANHSELADDLDIRFKKDGEFKRFFLPNGKTKIEIGRLIKGRDRTQYDLRKGMVLTAPLYESNLYKDLFFVLPKKDIPEALAVMGSRVGVCLYEIKRTPYFLEIELKESGRIVGSFLGRIGARKPQIH